MSFKLVLADGEMDRIRRRFIPDAQKLEAIGSIVKEQVDHRFDIQGDPSGKAWRPKVVDDNRKLLEGMDDGLRKSFKQASTDHTTEITSDHIAAFYAQEGTTKYGGKLPNILGKANKGLFIPLTDKGRRTRPITPMGIRAKRIYDATLIRGQIRPNGIITPANADYVYVFRSGIPAREFWPVSPDERQFQDDNAVQIIKGDTL